MKLNTWLLVSKEGHIFPGGYETKEEADNFLESYELERPDNDFKNCAPVEFTAEIGEGE